MSQKRLKGAKKPHSSSQKRKPFRATTPGRKVSERPTTVQPEQTVRPKVQFVTITEKNQFHYGKTSPFEKIIDHLATLFDS